MDFQRSSELTRNNGLEVEVYMRKCSTERSDNVDVVVFFLGIVKAIVTIKLYIINFFIP